MSSGFGGGPFQRGHASRKGHASPPLTGDEVAQFRGPRCLRTRAIGKNTNHGHPAGLAVSAQSQPEPRRSARWIQVELNSRARNRDAVQWHLGGQKKTYEPDASSQPEAMHCARRREETWATMRTQNDQVGDSGNDSGNRSMGIASDVGEEPGITMRTQKEKFDHVGLGDPLRGTITARAVHMGSKQAGGSKRFDEVDRFVVGRAAGAARDSERWRETSRHGRDGGDPQRDGGGERKETRGSRSEEAGGGKAGRGRKGREGEGRDAEIAQADTNFAVRSNWLINPA
ncbi:hypothetical protein DFH09DRAFT_1284204, partial [Mycena vulgaris]